MKALAALLNRGFIQKGLTIKKYCNYLNELSLRLGGEETLKYFSVCWLPYGNL